MRWALFGALLWGGTIQNIGLLSKSLDYYGGAGLAGRQFGPCGPNTGT